MTTEFQRGLLRAVEIASLYADENRRMCGDAIIADPILNDRLRKEIRNEAQLREATVKANSLALESFEHSCRSHAGQDIAELIRAEIHEKARKGKR